MARRNRVAKSPAYTQLLRNITVQCQGRNYPRSSSKATHRRRKPGLSNPRKSRNPWHRLSRESNQRSISKTRNPLPLDVSTYKRTWLRSNRTSQQSNCWKEENRMSRSTPKHPWDNLYLNLPEKLATMLERRSAATGLLESENADSTQNNQNTTK